MNPSKFLKAKNKFTYFQRVTLQINVKTGNAIYKEERPSFNEYDADSNWCFPIMSKAKSCAVFVASLN